MARSVQPMRTEKTKRIMGSRICMRLFIMMGSDVDRKQNIPTTTKQISALLSASPASKRPIEMIEMMMNAARKKAVERYIDMGDPSKVGKLFGCRADFV